MASSSRNINFSGELCDLSVPTWNNQFGNEHIENIMRHGINFPLDKFIDELDGILDSGAPQDDKSAKRIARQTFLHHCYESIELQNLFPLFCNYLNGCGSQSARTCIFGQYENSPFVITVAGGNIITLFSQLITNMIDSYTKSVNKFRGIHDQYYEYWDISARWYKASEFDDSSIGIRDYMFSTDFKDWEKSAWDIINETFRLLTPSNKLLLDALENDSDFSKEQIAFLITSHFLNNDEDGSVEEDLRFVAESPHSDFDFKLSPNIYPGFLESNHDRANENLEELISRLNTSSKKEMEQKYPPSAGFLLLRAKSLITCNSDDSLTKYTSKQLKQFQKDCSKQLGHWVYSLFPQTMQEDYLRDVHRSSDCWKFLNFLLEKKKIISASTRNNIDVVIKYYLSGYFKPQGSGPINDGRLPSAPQNMRQPNSTECVIHYLKYTTYHLNIYLETWPVLGLGGAPSKYYGDLPDIFSYKRPRGMSDKDYLKNCETAYRTTCFAFLNLDNILYQNNGLVSRISADCINYFLNNPLFHTEEILDRLIMYYNQQHGGSCLMPPSDVTLVPTNRSLSAAMKNLKNIFDKSRYSENGYPDGLRITVNAIETDYYDPPPDDRPDQDEKDTINIAARDDTILTEYAPLNSKSEFYTRPSSSRRGQGLKRKKTKKQKRKKQKRKKCKTKKYKIKKNKTKKHKIKKNKTKKYKSKKY